MDSHTVDHSDSDSGESWTVLDHTPLYPENAPELSEYMNERHLIVNNEKDEDTDGISIISDSEHESVIPPKTVQESYITKEETTEKQNHSHDSAPYVTSINKNINLDESVRGEDDFLVDSNGKLKTYVHRRNKRLSTVLNIIMLGSVITAAGVAIGHMWGAKNDCILHSVPSVNKILSNLYKLQEENAYLRNKLKELTILSHFQMQQQKMPFKHQRCKKVFEEPLNSKTANKLTKCLDGKNNEDEKFLEHHLMDPLFEKEFLGEINKLKNVYQQNKSWLDVEITRRIKYEEQHLKDVKNRSKFTKVNKTSEEKKSLMLDITKFPQTQEKEDLFVPATQNKLIDYPDSDHEEMHTDKKTSYADSLKTEPKNKNVHKKEIDKISENEFTQHISKKKFKKNYEVNPASVISEEEIKKDDRYNSHKHNNEKKKDKWRKKQKRKDRYGQFDINNLQAEEAKRKIEIMDNSKENHYIARKAENNKINAQKNNLPNWYEKRAKLRTESRKNLEQELFGEISLNDSGWYFRRMKRREQFRAKASNATHKKVSKSNMNFKKKY